jgi:hypothetical protein
MTRSAHGDDADGQPPRDTRFRKGRSGNPSGRPKKVASFKADLAAELQQKLVLVENGKQQRVSKQRAFIKTLVAAAIKKDIRAVNALLACMRFFGVGSEQVVAEVTEVGDLDLLESYLAQERKKQTREAVTSADTKNKSTKRK